MSILKLASLFGKFVLAAVALILAVGTLKALWRFHPITALSLAGIQPILDVVLLAALTGWAVAVTMEMRPGRGLIWTARIEIVTLFLMGLISCGYGSWWQGGLYVALAAIGGVLHDIAPSPSPGWIIDQNGERQRVDKVVRGHAVYKPTTRSRRIIQEAAENEDRRKMLFWAGLLTLLLLLVAVYGALHHNQPLATITGIAAGGAFVFGVLAPLVSETLYQLGYQDMFGAKVLDSAPYRPGPEDVAAQKAHGDADVASEAEARDLLNKRR